jgi:uncharacterized protein YkwD
LHMSLLRRVLICSLLVSLVSTTTTFASNSGDRCPIVGAISSSRVKGKVRILVCVSIGKKKVWILKPATTSTTTTTLAPTASFDSRGWESEILRITNVERRNAGLNPLVSCTRLANSALAHTNRMLEGKFFSHSDPGTGTASVDRIRSTGYLDSANSWGVGENIAMGYSSANATMVGWMNSPGHRANILNPSFTHLGVGVNTGKWDAWYRSVATQNFGYGGSC